VDEHIHKDKESEQTALEAVKRHHSHMLDRLDNLVSALIGAVEDRNAALEYSAQEVLVEWCEQELIPHALAEEGPLYEGPRNTPAGKLLVDGMLSEHRVIVELVEELRRSNGVRAAVAAGSIQRIFSLHLDKENQLLMPLIAGSAELSLASAVEGIHELIDESDQDHEQH
jgi:hypothetical protein